MNIESPPEKSGIRLRKAKPVRLFEQAVEQIKSLIVSGHLKPGDKLPGENQLSGLLDVSRPSVREAIRALESQGILQVKSGAGTFVAQDALVFSSINDAMERLLERKELVLQLLQVRGAIENLSVTLAAAVITKDELENLENIIKSQEDVVSQNKVPDNYSELAQLDAEFHIALSKASKNELVNELISALIPAFQDDNKAIYFVEKGSRLIEEHRHILNALKNCDSVGAGLAMDRHIDRVMEEVRVCKSSKSFGHMG